MRVYVYPADMFGCGYYRLIWPSKVLRALGCDVIIVPPSSRNNVHGVIDKEKDEVIDVQYPPDADVVIIQRPTHKYLKAIIPLIRKRGTAVVVDIDDDLSCIHPENPTFAIMHPRQGWDHNWRNAEVACANATAVTVSTPALAQRYMPHKRGAVLRNCVPHTYLTLDEDKEYPGFGWAGSVQSHPDDLQVVGDAPRRLVREGYRYYALGPGYKIQSILKLDDPPEVFGTIELQQYPLELARLRVGLAPLNLTKFNTAKSWLKPLEYAACGTPSVITPTPEYVELSKLGIGRLARNPRQWYRETKALLTNDSLYAELREAGRAACLALTFEVNAWRWLEVWADALAFERRSTSSAFSRT